MMHTTILRRAWLAAVLATPAAIAQGVVMPPQEPHFAPAGMSPPLTMPVAEVPALINAPVAAVTALTEADLVASPSLTEALINRAVVAKNHDLLAVLLPVYMRIPKHDAILAAYVRGALAYHAGRHKEAISAYRSILAAQPDLSYVRLDLAVMLYEDKQYTAAEDQFYRLRTEPLAPQALALAEAYLAQIRQQRGWQYGLGLEYTRNNNINNASAMRELPSGGIKSENSLPKSASGLAYAASFKRQFNWHGNHYGQLGADVNGLYYHQEPDYRELSWRLYGGYQYQDSRRRWALTPQLEYNRLGGQAYGRQWGVNSEYEHWLGRQWQGSASYQYRRKYYVDAHNRDYEGHWHYISATLAYWPRASQMGYIGIDAMADRLAADANSSNRIGLYAGAAQEWRNGLGTRFSARYGQRRFLADPDPALAFWSGYHQRRRDHEYQFNAAVWHRNLHAWGLTPRLNLRYQTIDSNMPAFYSRRGWQTFISVDKTF